MLRYNGAFTAVDRELLRRSRRRLVILVIPIILALVGLSLYRQQSQVNQPVTYVNDEDHFKYGSITTDSTSGIPYWIWRTMPEV
jgi:hypothetical protein